MTKANAAVAIIAKNAASTIGQCLDSIIPYVEQVVVCVDENTTDNTAQIARDRGAEVYEGLVVSQEHECSAHGRVKVQHFANARQESFTHLRSDVDWHGWMDADDTLDGGEKLVKFLTELPPNIDVVWLPYHYSKAGVGGPTSTIFDRERFVRTNNPWAWQYRVHEVLSPVGRPMEYSTMVRTDDISLVHQSEGHDTEASARRNILCLEIDLEENINDMRAWFYLGNQYFALSAWNEAIESYERSMQSDNVYQLWQSLLYLSMSYEKIGDLDSARFAAFRAADLQPAHPEPYLRLSTVYTLMNDLGRAKFWHEFGMTLPDPPQFVFLNPMDRQYNSHLTMAAAYANAGYNTRARMELEIANKVIPSKELADGIAMHRQIEEDTQTADAIVRTMQVMPMNLAPQTVLETLPENIKRFGRVRDQLVPSIIQGRVSTQPRILFWCGRSAEPWAPLSINTTGIGGSETAVIQIAKRFAASGWRVDVYNDCDKYEGVYDGVGYWDCGRLLENEQTDVFVSWRNPAAFDLPLSRKVSVLWCHDLNSGAGGLQGTQRAWNMVLGVSNWHANYMSELYGIQAPYGFVPNGIVLDRFDQKKLKTPFRCVYSSSPDRGLETLLQIWPSIVEQEPKAELHIAYGWDTMDAYIRAGHQQLAVFKEHMQQLIASTPNVVWRGRLPQDELAKLYCESVAMLYPTNFLETFCISAIEAMAGDCVVVSSGAGAVPETVGDAGLVVTGNVYTKAWRDYYTYIARAVMCSPEVRIGYIGKGRKRVQGMTWDKSYEDHWVPKIDKLLTEALSCV